MRYTYYTSKTQKLQLFSDDWRNLFPIAEKENPPTVACSEASHSFGGSLAEKTATLTDPRGSKEVRARRAVDVHVFYGYWSKRALR